MAFYTVEPFKKLLLFLSRLQRAKIHYSLAHFRDSVMVMVAVPGERWEVEFFEDSHVEFERFISSGDIYDEEMLDELITKHSD